MGAITPHSRKNLPILKEYKNVFFWFASFLSTYFIRGKIVHQSWLTSQSWQNLIVNYPLAVSYTQLCHIRTNVNYWCAFIIPSQHRCWFLHFLVQDYESYFNKWIDLSAISCQNIAVFIAKALLSFLQIQEKLRNYEFGIERF